LREELSSLKLFSDRLFELLFDKPESKALLAYSARDFPFVIVKPGKAIVKIATMVIFVYPTNSLFTSKDLLTDNTIPNHWLILLILG